MNRYALFLFLLLAVFTETAVASDVEVELIDSAEWNDKEREEIIKATQVAFSRMLRADVANCAYRNSFHHDRDKLRKSWGSEIPVLNKTKKVKIAIRKTGAKVLGMAKVGVAKIDRRNYQVFNLEIYLNNEMLHKHLQANQALDQIGLWANVIAHEVAHNFGYTHGTSGNWTKDYPGYFPTELGYCVMSDGRTGSQGK